MIWFFCLTYLIETYIFVKIFWVVSWILGWWQCRWWVRPLVSIKFRAQLLLYDNGIILTCSSAQIWTFFKNWILVLWIWFWISIKQVRRCRVPSSNVAKSFIRFKQRRNCLSINFKTSFLSLCIDLLHYKSLIQTKWLLQMSF